MLLLLEQCGQGHVGVSSTGVCPLVVGLARRLTAGVGLLAAFALGFDFRFC